MLYKNICICKINNLQNKWFLHLTEVVINSPKKKKAKATKGKEKEGSDTEEDSDVVSPKKKKKTAKDKLLDAKLSDNSDSDVVPRKGYVSPFYQSKQFNYFRCSNLGLYIAMYRCMVDLMV